MPRTRPFPPRPPRPPINAVCCCIVWRTALKNMPANWHSWNHWMWERPLLIVKYSIFPLGWKAFAISPIWPCMPIMIFLWPLNILKRASIGCLTGPADLSFHGTSRYDVATFSNPSRSVNWQFQQQFSGSVFGPSTQLLQSAGTDYAWNIVYQGNTYNGIPGVCETANGAFNPRQQGVSAYNPRSSWSDYAAGYGVAGSEIGLAVAGGFLGAAVKWLKL